MNTWKGMVRFLALICVTVWLAACGGSADVNGAIFSASGAKTGSLKLYLETNPVYFMTGETVLSFYEIILRLKQIQV